MGRVSLGMNCGERSGVGAWGIVVCGRGGGSLFRAFVSGLEC